MLISDSSSRCQSNAVDQDSLDYYFSLLKKALEDSNLFDEACCIYNMDKTGMPLDHKQPKRIAPKGMKKFMDDHQTTNVKLQSSLVPMLLALYYLPPMVTFKSEHFNHEWTKG